MVPLRVHTILISTQHSPDVTNDHIHKELMEHVIKPVVPAKYLDAKTIFHLNPSGALPTSGAHLVFHKLAATIRQPPTRTGQEWYLLVCPFIMNQALQLPPNIRSWLSSIPAMNMPQRPGLYMLQ